MSSLSQDLQPDPSFLQTVVAELPDALIVHRAGVVKFVNPACITLLRADSPTGLLGRQILDFVHPDDRASTVERMEHLARTGQPQPPRPLRLIDLEGQEHSVELSRVCQIDVDGGPANLILLRTRAREDALEARLQLAERFTAMGEIAGSLTHEISNPLTYVLGNLSVLDELLENHEQRDVHEALADARVGAERVRDLIRDLKLMSNPDDVIASDVDVFRVLDAALNTVAGIVRERARVERRFGILPRLVGYSSRLSLMFARLVLLRASQLPAGKDNVIRVSAEVTGPERLLVRVTDNGPPLNEAERASLGANTGDTARLSLALSVCQAVAAAHGGIIEAPRGDDRARLEITLPCLPPVEERPRAPRESGAVRPGRILVVDDDLVIGALLRRALAGHQVYLVTSGDDAVELCTELWFDVVVLDIRMPGISGPEVYDLISKHRPGLEQRIVFMTAGPLDAGSQSFLRDLDNEVISKPFDFDVLRRAVESHLQAKESD